jgi:hypothetical protein
MLKEKCKCKQIQEDTVKAMESPHTTCARYWQSYVGGMDLLVFAK